MKTIRNVIDFTLVAICTMVVLVVMLFACYTILDFVAYVAMI
jgi:hypothetical protein